MHVRERNVSRHQQLCAVAEPGPFPARLVKPQEDVPLRVLEEKRVATDGGEGVNHAAEGDRLCVFRFSSVFKFQIPNSKYTPNILKSKSPKSAKKSAVRTTGMTRLRVSRRRLGRVPPWIGMSCLQFSLV